MQYMLPFHLPWFDFYALKDQQVSGSLDHVCLISKALEAVLRIVRWTSSTLKCAKMCKKEASMCTLLSFKKDN